MVLVKELRIVHPCTGERICRALLALRSAGVANVRSFARAVAEFEKGQIYSNVTIAQQLTEPGKGGVVSLLACQRTVALVFPSSLDSFQPSFMSIMGKCGVLFTAAFRGPLLPRDTRRGCLQAVYPPHWSRPSPRMGERRFSEGHDIEHFFLDVTNSCNRPTFL